MCHIKKKTLVPVTHWIRVWDEYSKKKNQNQQCGIISNKNK